MAKVKRKTISLTGELLKKGDKAMELYKKSCNIKAELDEYSEFFKDYGQEQSPNGDTIDLKVSDGKIQLQFPVRQKIDSGRIGELRAALGEQFPLFIIENVKGFKHIVKEGMIEKLKKALGKKFGDFIELETIADYEPKKEVKSLKQLLPPKKKELLDEIITETKMRKINFKVA